ncbi:MAG: serine/threonine protein kinase [Deltaproteobacteria bacterium]|nr:serine/threonine protein kinase [Deltaproteobacteria bacterium]MDQ3295970.1 serine/threonine protein kinase [Myxococcota bacterium]
MADCQLCGAHHPDEVEVCPKSRSGQQIGDKYVLGPLLGVGGIAAVYAAEHAVLRREIAVKILHQRFAKDRELAARFVREARETAGLGHPAFVRVYDAGTTPDGCAFIEMDRLEGRELYSLRKAEGPFDPARVVRLSIDILDGLAALHARGVIHRDLKTQNIYVVPTADGGEQIKLLDLGFAKVADELQLTSKDHILGTPFYISPEQYRDPSAVDARADLFSLGVVMFELLIGDWPYEWTTKRDLLGKVLKGDLERHPAERRRDVPAWLDAIVARSLAFAREDRFESALAMKTALEAGAPPEKPGLLSRLFGG